MISRNFGENGRSVVKYKQWTHVLSFFRYDCKLKMEMFSSRIAILLDFCPAHHPWLFSRAPLRPTRTDRPLLSPGLGPPARPDRPLRPGPDRLGTTRQARQRSTPARPARAQVRCTRPCPPALSCPSSLASLRALTLTSFALRALSASWHHLLLA